MAKKRAEIAEQYKWDIASLYSDASQWEHDYNNALALADAFATFTGRLYESGPVLLSAFCARDAVWQLTERVCVYARQRRDEDNTDPARQGPADRAHALMAKVAAATSFFIPEIISLDDETMDAFLAAEPGLQIYDFELKSIRREKPHILGPSEEEILARLSEALGATSDIFTMLSDADLCFGEIPGEDGKPTELTHGNYIKFMESKNRAVRKAAYEAMYAAYISMKNTLATSYAYNTKTDVITAGIRKYPSSLEAALSSDNVSREVYLNLVDTVNKNLPVLHSYLDTKQRLLGLDRLAMYDVYAPVVDPPDADKDITFEEAIGIMEKALAPLGSEYTKIAAEGARGGWVDIYENEGKSSGAYSFGSYDSKPFILMNYAGKIKDVFTLIHEMGHSMHSYYTRRTQPFVYGSHSIFTAEVASTVNENLLVRYLLKNAEDDQTRAYYTGIFLEEFRTTLFRQTMFAEFELLTHEAAERGEPLTNEALCDFYGALNEKYFGPHTDTDENIRSEWSRIPHFYRAFYVYKYATGFSAAAAIASRILREGQPAVDDYLRFLTTGNSDDPIELLKIAGVDMSKPDPIEAALQEFASLAASFDQLTQ
ncbi:MAG: oligoendopeptidase F [Clostridiales Family XIII bacterium]|nr:oligoendopeptidase F [Clostridiales Family XIII bacterium]